MINDLLGVRMLRVSRFLF